MTNEAGYIAAVRKSVRQSVHWAYFNSDGTPRVDAVPATLTREEALAIVERQGYRCALTGLPFEPGGYGPRRPTKDRIVAELGYVASNVRYVTAAVNAMRGNGTDVDLREIALAILARTPTA